MARMRMWPRRGMTLMEVIVAMTILAGALLALATFASRLAASSTSAKLDATADELASDRLETAKNKKTYLGVDSLIATENPPSGPRGVGFKRVTAVKRVGGAPTDSMDYKIVTVTVSHPKMLTNKAKSITIAAY